MVHHLFLTPAISMMVRSVISLSTLRRAALWRKVMAFRRSPSDTLTNAAILYMDTNSHHTSALQLYLQYVCAVMQLV